MGAVFSGVIFVALFALIVCILLVGGFRIFPR